MRVLLMSLLFLTNVLDVFQALDDSGRPLPGAVLTFWKSETVTPEPVYADQDLLQILSDAKGRVVADAQGRFELIYLSEAAVYRVRLETAQGVLRWDVDPYLCDCTEPPRVFRSPLHQALTRASDNPPAFAPPPKPGALLRFTLTGTDEPRDTWADAARRVANPNPLRANAGGFFPPVYLDEETEYRVKLDTASGVSLLDVDPYECQCGFLLFTSNQYPFEWRDAAGGIGGGSPLARFDPVFSDAAVGAGGVMTSGTMQEPIIGFSFHDPDAAIGVGGGMTSATMIAPLLFYGDWSADSAIGAGGGMTSATMIAPLIFYSNWPVDASIGAGGSINSGTMT